MLYQIFHPFNNRDNGKKIEVENKIPCIQMG
jgi:hypothetical protein